MGFQDHSGPAFPFAPTDASNVSMQSSGMTLRDYFAAQALAGLLANPDRHAWKLGAFCENAYEYADAMIKARQ